MNIEAVLYLTPGPDLRFIDGKMWMVLAPFVAAIHTDNGRFQLTVPAGFKTDGGSIPRILWEEFGHPMSAICQGAVLHDRLYQRPVLDCGTRINREAADDILLQANLATGIKRATAEAYHAGLFVGGWETWNKYRKIEKEENHVAS